MSTHLLDFVIVTILLVVRLDLWALPCLPVMLIILPIVDQVAPTAVKFQSVDLCGKYKYVTTFWGRPINRKCSRCVDGVGLSEELQPSWPRVIFDIVDIVVRQIFSGSLRSSFYCCPLISDLLWILGCVKQFARIKLHDFSRPPHRNWRPASICLQGGVCCFIRSTSAFLRSP